MTDYQNIPEDLKVLPQWVLRKGKKPINPNNGYGAKADVSETWGTFNQCMAAIIKDNYQNYDGIGFEFNGKGIVGIDIDHCIDEIGLLSKEARSIVERLVSYTEISPSGTGIHIFVYGDIPEKGRKHTEKGIELYKSGRYFTVTGNVYGDLKPVEHRDSEILALYNELFPQCRADQITIDYQNTLSAPQQYASPLTPEKVIELDRTSKQGSNFNKLFNGDISGYPSASEADMAFCNMLAFWCQGDPQLMDSVFISSKLNRKKWDEKHGPLTYGQITINEAISKCTSFYTPGSQVVASVAKIEPAKLKVIDSSEYNQMEFKEIEWLVTNILPDKGFAALSAKPKIGKTWLGYQLSFAISTGGSLMGTSVKKGTV
ncbi:MAG: AAA family ATPase, partial [Firmicutes bacterium]|nr:AAA family ATPase [Bacillota bacterium]